MTWLAIGTLVCASSAIHPVADPAFLDVPFEELRLHEPANAETALTFDRSWEGPESGYATVVQLPGAVRLYYRGGGDYSREVTCLAISPDGRRFERTRTNAFGPEMFPPDANAIWTGTEKTGWEAHNFAPFLDTNPAARPEERWKAVAQAKHPRTGNERRKVLVSLVSSDGVHWRRASEEPILTDGAFDSHNVAFFDASIARYVCYYRVPRDGRRWVKRATSLDFVRWSPGEWVEFPSLDRHQLYTNGIQPYPDVPGLFVAMPMRFVPERKSVGHPPKATDGVSDGLLLFGRGGTRFESHFGQAWIPAGRDAENWGWAHGNQTPVAGIVRFADHWRVYWMDHYGSTPRVRTGEIRPHGFVSLTGRGAVVRRSNPFALSGDELRLNFRTSAVGRVRVGLLQPDLTAVPGFGIEDCVALYGDELAEPVRWKGGRLRDAGLKSGRLAIALEEAELFSVEVVGAES